jgi:Zn-finger nucleic acid-binding protein
MKCPRCKSPLETIDLGEFGGDYAAVVIDSCPECGGVWYDRGELDARDESVWTDVETFDFEPRLSGGRHALCPRCEVSLIPVSPKGVRQVVIDRCPDCFGFWLDEGELEAVQTLASQLDSEILRKMTVIPQPDESRGRLLGAFLFLTHRK